MATAKRNLWLPVGASLVLYAASFALPVFVCKDGSVFIGLMLFLWGLVGVASACPAWLANPLLFLTLSLMVRRKFPSSLISACLTLAVALTSFFVKSLYTGPNMSDITHYGPGLYVWLSACTVPLLAICLQWAKSFNGTALRTAPFKDI